MIIEHYLDIIEETNDEVVDYLDYERELEQVRYNIQHPGQHLDLPEDFDLHVDYYQGELIDHRTRM